MVKGKMFPVLILFRERAERRSRAVVSFYENQRDDVDYIMPVVTQSCSVSRERTSLSWEEDFIFKEQYSAFIDKDSYIILFFELVDLIYISYTNDQCERVHKYVKCKTAWAFLKLLGSNGVPNTGSKMRLQLYEPLKSLKRKETSSVEVYNWWLKNDWISYKEASLYITIKPHSTITVEPALRSMMPNQQEIKKEIPENCDNLQQSTSVKKELSIENDDAFTSCTSKKKHAAGKYRTLKLDESTLSGSGNMYSIDVEGDRKESLTAVITKSGQFNVIAVPDFSACSDSNTFRSVRDNQAVLNRSLRRSQRLKKLFF